MLKTTALHVHHAFLYISLPFVHEYDAKIGSLSKDVFERRTSTGSGLFSFFDGGFAQIFSHIASITVKKLRNTNFISQGMLRGKIPHFRLTCVAQKGRCLSSLISCLNDSETQETGLWGVKIPRISQGSMPLDCPRNLRLSRTFRKLVNIYPRSLPASY